MSFLENIKLFFQGALDMKGRSISHIENEAEESMDQFMLLCFSDLLGIDMPTTYYALELLPYLGDDLESWLKRMDSKKSVWESRGAGLDIDP
ncbi:MAG: hypothetical protein JEZ08_02310 [Clostridiales bacterium]|nr:hypothetical protein [Clostridiales bacterium]